jgi:hypothetical protein
MPSNDLTIECQMGFSVDKRQLHAKALMPKNALGKTLQTSFPWIRDAMYCLGARQYTSWFGRQRALVFLTLSAVSVLCWTLWISLTQMQLMIPMSMAKSAAAGICDRQVEDYVALVGCCSSAGLGHALAALNRVVHIAQRLHLRFVYDPRSLHGLGHGIGDDADAFFDFRRYEHSLDQVPPDHVAIRFSQASLENVHEHELIKLIQQWRCSWERYPSLRSRPLFFQFDRVFNPGGALAPSWTFTACWWRAAYRRSLASKALVPQMTSSGPTSANRTISLAIHVRRGDQVPRHPHFKANAYVEAGLRRNLPDAWYVAAASAAWSAYCQHQHANNCTQHLLHIRIFSESPMVDMDGSVSKLDQWLRLRFPTAIISRHLDTFVFETLTTMATADIFVGSRSALSILAARFASANSTVLIPPQLPSRYHDPNEAPLPCSLSDAPRQLRVVAEPPGTLYWPAYVAVPVSGASLVNTSHQIVPHLWVKVDRPVWRMSRYPIGRNYFNIHWPPPRNWSHLQREMRDPSHERWIPKNCSEVRVLPHCA